MFGCIAVAKKHRCYRNDTRFIRKPPRYIRGWVQKRQDFVRDWRDLSGYTTCQQTDRTGSDVPVARFQWKWQSRRKPLGSRWRPLNGNGSLTVRTIYGCASYRRPPTMDTSTLDGRYSPTAKQTVKKTYAYVSCWRVRRQWRVSAWPTTRSVSRAAFRKRPTPRQAPYRFRRISQEACRKQQRKNTNSI